MKNSRRMQGTILGFRINSIRSKARRANVTVTITRPDGVTKTEYYENAVISRLLLWMVNNKKVLVKHDYSTDRYSDSEELGPIRLVDALDGDGNIVHIFSYITEKAPQRMVTYTPDGAEVVYWQNRKFKPEAFNRYYISNSLYKMMREKREAVTA